MKSKRLSISIPEEAYEVLKSNYKQKGYTTLNSFIVQSAIGNLQNNISTNSINYVSALGGDFSLKEDHEKDHDHNR